MNKLNWSKSVSNNEAYRRAGGRRRINKQRQAAAFWRSMEVWWLGRQGKRPLEIAAELGIHPTTAYRHYWQWFGKLRPIHARKKRLTQRIEAYLEEQRRRHERRNRPPRKINLAQVEALFEQVNLETLEFEPGAGQAASGGSEVL